MADTPMDMFELAKKLIPDIETNMPAQVREAFEAGKVKSIFRTGPGVAGENRIFARQGRYAFVSLFSTRRWKSCQIWR